MQTAVMVYSGKDKSKDKNKFTAKLMKHFIKDKSASKRILITCSTIHQLIRCHVTHTPHRYTPTGRTK